MRLPAGDRVCRRRCRSQLPLAVCAQEFGFAAVAAARRCHAQPVRWGSCLLLPPALLTACAQGLGFAAVVAAVAPLAAAAYSLFT